MYVWYAYIWYHRYHIDCDIHRFIIFTKIFLLHSITSYELRLLFFLRIICTYTHLQLYEGVASSPNCKSQTEEESFEY